MLVRLEGVEPSFPAYQADGLPLTYRRLERLAGFEPALSPWQGDVLPGYTIAARRLVASLGFEPRSPASKTGVLPLDRRGSGARGGIRTHIPPRGWPFYRRLSTLSQTCSARAWWTARGIEPPSPACKAGVLPLNYAPKAWWNRRGTIPHLPRARRVLSQLSYGPIRLS